MAGAGRPLRHRALLAARGVAFGDLNNDGWVDIVINCNNGPAVILENHRVGGNHWLLIDTKGTRSNRDGIGAVVRVISGNDKQWKMLRSGSSYLSQSELVLTFGLGAHAKADAIEIQWPSGQLDKLSNVNAAQTTNAT